MSATATAETVPGESPAPPHPPKVKPARVNLNVTSMVDILFNLLVYFIVTAAVVTQEGALRAALPGSGTPLPRPLALGEPQIVLLRPTGEAGCALSLQAQPLPDFDALHAALVRRAASGAVDRARDQVVIQPEAGVRWQHVVNAFNQSVRAGYTQVSFAPVAQAGRR